MKTTVKHLPKSQAELTVEVDENDLAEAQAKVLRRAAGYVNVPGFRPGKAPLNFVRERLKEEFLREEGRKILADDSFAKAVEKENLEPIDKPEIESKNKDALPKFKFTFAVWPKVKLGDYKKALKEIRSGKKIETAKTLSEAEKKASQEKKKHLKRAEKLGKQTPQEAEQELEEKVWEVLLQNCPVEVPEVLINKEVSERLLPERERNIKRLGLTLENYLKAAERKSLEEFKKELRQEAKKIIKLRLILQEIAEQEGLPLENEDDMRYIMDRLKKIAGS